MKKSILIISFVMCCMGLWAQQEYMPAVTVGTMAPELVAADTLGRKHSLEELRGQYVVVDFWASWCGDCRREIPELLKVERMFRNRTVDGKAIAWLSISFDDKREQWRNALRQYGMPWTQVSNGKAWKANPVAKSWGISWLPSFVIVDPEGKVVATAITAEGVKEGLAKLTGDILLPVPQRDGASSTMTEALRDRHSVRSFDMERDLTKQQLSDLCWAACGVNREDGRLTSPTARNLQEIRLFVFTKTGAYEYMAKENMLTKVATGDYRGLMAGNGDTRFKQDFVMDAPVSLLMVIDFEKFGSNDEMAMQMGCVDAGNVSENVNLYCQAVGLATVPRATHDRTALRKLLGLSEKQLPIMNNPVGYENSGN